MTIPAPKKTAAYRLFHHRYLVRVPEILLFSKTYLDKVGYGISGDAAVDAGIAKRIVTVNQTGAGIAILHSEGAPLDFVNTKKIPLLYNDIQEHLKDWLRMVHMGVHPKNVPPLSDFRKFEGVASDLHRIAKLKQPIEADMDGVKNRILAMQRGRNPLAATMRARKKHFDDDGGLKPYISIVDEIEDIVAEG